MPCIYSLNSSKGHLFIPLRKETLLGGFPPCALLLSPTSLGCVHHTCPSPGPGLWHMSKCVVVHDPWPSFQVALHQAPEQTPRKACASPHVPRYLLLLPWALIHRHTCFGLVSSMSFEFCPPVLLIFPIGILQSSRPGGPSGPTE